MPDQNQHYAVEFAARYADPTNQYLSASVALWRLTDLIEDAKKLSDQFDIAMPEKDRWYPWFGAEVISYYSVGFVTCLEWHARSRLVDFLTFRPLAIKSEDLKVLKEKVVVEMLAANVTVASIVGAATNISRLEEYMGIFSRLFSAFDSNFDGFKAIQAKNKKTGLPWVADEEIEELKSLYTFRNSLVHEIGITRVGHWNVRENWNPEDVIRIGELVQRTMRAIEASIVEKMPKDFPRILGSDDLVKPEWERLAQEIPILEKKIGEITTAFTDQPVEKDVNWEPAKTAAADYMAKEMLFLEQASMLHNRYIEMREPLKINLIRSRHSYLKSIIDTVGSVWEIEEQPKTEADLLTPSPSTPQTA